MEQRNLLELTEEGEARRDDAYSTAPQSVSSLEFYPVTSLPPFGDIKDYQLFEISLSNDTSTHTHGLHRFPAKYIPQIPRWAMQQFAKPGARVVDPFMGSGTTLVEGLLRNQTTVGIDIDPLAKLISRAKTDVPRAERIAALGEEIRSKWAEPSETLKEPMPDIANFGHWFGEDAWGKLQALLKIIVGLDCDDAERRFLLVVFSSILRWVSNADDQSQKTYVSGTNVKAPPEVKEAFWKSFNRAYRGLRQLELTRDKDARVIIEDGRSATSMGLEDDSVDLMVTSPPYLDSVDYMYNFMMEYFWLGPLLDVADRKTFNLLRRNALGAKLPSETVARPPDVLDDLFDYEEIPEPRKRATAAYLNGMRKHFAEAARCLRGGARYVLVVGNSQTTKGVVPVHDCLIRLAAVAGLNLEKAFGYRVRRHYMKFPRGGRGGIILIDWILVLRKEAGVSPYPQRLPLPWVTLGVNDVAH